MTERREIDRHHHWRPEAHPRDPDAHPDSGWIYAHLIPEEPLKFPVIKPARGPDSGVKCHICPDKRPMYVVDSHTIEEVLGPLAEETNRALSEEVKKMEERQVALMCTNDHVALWRESLLPIKVRPS